MTWSSPQSPGEPDEVGFGSARPPGRRWPRGPRWVRGPSWARRPLIIAGAVVIAVAAVLALGRHPARSDPARAAVTVTQAGHRLLGVRAGWELLGYGPGRTVRVQFARGRVTQTVLPALDSNGPVSFVAGPSQMIIRPWDIVPGYVVPDGKPAQPLTGVLRRGAEVVINPLTGGRRQLGGPPVASVSAASPGVIAPDGTTAALFRVTAGGQVTLHLVSLATGADQPIPVRLGPDSVGPGKLAWSPDSRWLFVVTAHGGLAAVNAGTRSVEGLGVWLPWLSQIAVRNASG